MISKIMYDMGLRPAVKKRDRRYDQPWHVGNFEDRKTFLRWYAPIFWSRVEIIPGDESCWTWKGARSDFGYGQIRMEGKLWSAHRAAFRLTKGEIPAGMFVLHVCDNPPCVRPKHLYLGTHLENARDRVARRGR